MSCRKKNTLPHAVQSQLSQLVAPATVQITIDCRDLDIIHAYRKAKDDLDKAINAAIHNDELRGGSGYDWSSGDRAICDAAEHQFNQCKLEMAVIFDYAAKKVGV